MHRLVACFIALASSQAVAQVDTGEGAACRIVVLNLVGKNLSDVDKDVPALLTDTLAQQVSVDSGCQVMTQADVAEMLDFEASKAACGDGDSCLSELGQALGAERVVGGSLGRLGNDFILNARLMNAKTGVVEGRAEQVVAGSAEKLRVAAQNVSRELFGKPLVVAPAVAVEPAAASSQGTSPLVYVGGGILALGVVGVVAGGVVAGLADSQLANPDTVGKDGVFRTGQAGLVGVGVGAVLVVAGVIAVVVPLVVE